MTKTKVKCTCPRCRGDRNAHPVYGYDTTKVPAIKCLVCDRPIGPGPYLLATELARFGTMSFAHAGCVPAKELKHYEKP